MNPKTPPNPVSRRMLIALALGVLVLGAVGLSAAAIEFTQTFPAVPSTSGLSPGCTSAQMTATPWQNGTVTYWCGGASSLTVASGGVTATPTFALPAGVIALWVYNAASPVPSNTTNCLDLPGHAALTSGSPSTLSPANYDYCLMTTGTSVASFAITWAVGS